MATSCEETIQHHTTITWHTYLAHLLGAAASCKVLIWHCRHPHGLFSMFSLALGHAETCEKQGLGLIVDWILSLLQFSCFHSSSPSFTREYNKFLFCVGICWIPFIWLSSLWPYSIDYHRYEFLSNQSQRSVFCAFFEYSKLKASFMDLLQPLDQPRVQHVCRL